MDQYENTDIQQTIFKYRLIQTIGNEFPTFCVNVSKLNFQFVLMDYDRKLFYNERLYNLEIIEIRSTPQQNNMKS